MRKGLYLIIITMFRRFLSGFMTCFPFVCLSDKDIKYFPEEIYRNDWKTVGIDIKNTIKKQQKI